MWRQCRRMGPTMLGIGGFALPAAGGVGDQPAALMDAFDLFEAWSKGS